MVVSPMTEMNMKCKEYFDPPSCQNAQQRHCSQINAKAGYERGATALQLAAIQGFLGIAKMLLDLGADVDARGSNNYGRTALEGAAEWGRLDMVQLLLNHGVQVGGEGRRQYIRAVKFARKDGHHAIERLLVNYTEWNSEDLLLIQ